MQRILVRYDNQWTPLETYLGLLTVNNGGDLLAMLGEQDASSGSGAGGKGTPKGSLLRGGSRGAAGEGAASSTGNAGNFWGVKLGRGRSGQRGSQSDTATTAAVAPSTLSTAAMGTSDGAEAGTVSDAAVGSVAPIQASTPTRKRSRNNLLQEDKEGASSGGADGQGESGAFEDETISMAGATKATAAAAAAAADAAAASAPKRIFVRKTYTFTEVVEVLGSGLEPRVAAMGAQERCDVFQNDRGAIGEPRATLISRLSMQPTQLATLNTLLKGFTDAQSSTVVTKLGDAGIEGLLADTAPPLGEAAPMQTTEALFPATVAQPSPLLSQWMK